MTMFGEYWAGCYVSNLDVSPIGLSIPRDIDLYHVVSEYRESYWAIKMYVPTPSDK